MSNHQQLKSFLSSKEESSPKQLPVRKRRDIEDQPEVLKPAIASAFANNGFVANNRSRLLCNFKPAGLYQDCGGANMATVLLR
ncbi:hypothetical protein R6Q59_004484 [Mikania micrantha]